MAVFNFSSDVHLKQLFMLYVLLRYSTAVISLDDNYVCTDFSLRRPCYLFAFDSKSPKFMLHDRLTYMSGSGCHPHDLHK